MKQPIAYRTGKITYRKKAGVSGYCSDRYRYVAVNPGNCIWLDGRSFYLYLPTWSRYCRNYDFSGLRVKNMWKYRSIKEEKMHLQNYIFRYVNIFMCQFVF